MLRASLHLIITFPPFIEFNPLAFELLKLRVSPIPPLAQGQLSPHEFQLDQAIGTMKRQDIWTGGGFGYGQPSV